MFENKEGAGVELAGVALDDCGVAPKRGFDAAVVSLDGFGCAGPPKTDELPCDGCGPRLLKRPPPLWATEVG